jgi:hypothetical protein
MSADDRLKVIARHLGAGRNGFHTSIATRLCSSENQHSDTAQGGVVHPQVGSSNDARKPRSKPVKSVIPKNRYAFLPVFMLICPAFYFVNLSVFVRRWNILSFSCRRLTRVPPQSYVINGIFIKSWYLFIFGGPQVHIAARQLRRLRLLLSFLTIDKCRDITPN